MSVKTQSDQYGKNAESGSTTFNCPTGFFITSLGGRVGWAFEGMHMECSNGSIGNISQADTDGFQDTSSSGYTGMNFWTGDFVDAFQGISASGALGNKIGTGGGGATAPFNCPSGMVLTGFSGGLAWDDGNNVNVVSGMRVSCNYPVDCTSVANAFHPNCPTWCSTNPGICQANQKAYCTEGNLETSTCQTFCNTSNSVCDTAIKSYCNNPWYIYNVCKLLPET